LLIHHTSPGVFCKKSNTTGAIGGEGIAFPSVAHEFTPAFSGVHVARFFIFFFVQSFVDYCFPFVSFGYCSSSIYGF
jgi:hypothetical protein